MAELVRLVKGRLSPEIRLGVHCHNDLGMATANTLSAVRAGADQFDATIAGIGERAGMAALEEVVMALATRRAFYGVTTRVRTQELNRTGKLLTNSVNLALHPHKAVLGDNAFAHEAGVHQHGMMKSPQTYAIMKPEDVGVHVNRLVLGKHSGKAALRERLEQLGFRVDDGELEEIFRRFKALADTKTVNDADIEKLVSGKMKRHQAYALHSFVVNSGTQLTATAVVKLEHDGNIYEHVARGESPTIAAFNAVDKIIKKSYPLHHFSIQSISEGRTELGESTVQVWNGDRLETGRGLNTDIVEASIEAYLSAINHALSRPE
jgi:2-isopropylmalate synthase